jgi:hypothetical protein
MEKGLSLLGRLDRGARVMTSAGDKDSLSASVEEASARGEDARRVYPP